MNSKNKKEKRGRLTSLVITSFTLLLFLFFINLISAEKFGYGTTPNSNIAQSSVVINESNFEHNLLLGLQGTGSDYFHLNSTMYNSLSAVVQNKYVPYINANSSVNLTSIELLTNSEFNNGATGWTTTETWSYGNDGTDYYAYSDVDGATIEQGNLIQGHKYIITVRSDVGDSVDVYIGSKTITYFGDGYNENFTIIVTAPDNGAIKLRQYYDLGTPTIKLYELSVKEFFDLRVGDIDAQTIIFSSLKSSTTLGTLGSGAVSLGYASKAVGSGSFAVGGGAEAMETDAIAIGMQANATGSASVAIGSQAKGAGNNAIAIGDNAFVNSTSVNSVAIGTQAHAFGQYVVALGYQALADGLYSFAGGFEADAGGQYGVALGYSSNAEGSESISLGALTDATGTRSSVLGYNVKATATGTTTIGKDITEGNASTITLGVTNKFLKMNSTEAEFYTNVTFNGLIRLKTITLPTCASATNGTIGRNTTKLYFCDGSVWNALY